MLKILTNATIELKENIETCKVHTSKSMRKRSTEKPEEHNVSQQKSSFDKKETLVQILHCKFDICSLQTTRQITKICDWASLNRHRSKSR